MIPEPFYMLPKLFSDKGRDKREAIIESTVAERANSTSALFCPLCAVLCCGMLCAVS